MGIIQSAVARIRRTSNGPAWSQDFNGGDPNDVVSNKPSKILHVRSHSGGLKVPQFNTIIQVIAMSRETGQSKVLPIVRCSQSPSKYVVLFDEDEVDFKIQVDNLHNPRHCGVLVVMNHRIGKFIIHKYADVPIKSLESSGKRFHFSVLARTKELEESKDHLKLDTLNPAIGHIGLSIRYSHVRQDPGIYTIRIKPLRGRHIFLEVCPQDKIFSLKERIEEDVGFPIYEQRLIRDGKLLDNTVTLESCGIRNGDVIYLVRKLRHNRIAELIGSGRVQRCMFTPKIQVANEENLAKIRFETDDSIEVKPFLLELRMNPKNLGISSQGKFLVFLKRLVDFF
ncbi:unnamed protein product [Allacma fusca]|uniref:Ubiquitin-like domain-containing protein n=1 Tax=Allacma fusca TaxID=39272 RepID=A0A8J2JZ61_9HEXA|nr:unnamed protein product [Allacma fusca]